MKFEHSIFETNNSDVKNIFNKFLKTNKKYYSINKNDLLKELYRIKIINKDYIINELKKSGTPNELSKKMDKYKEITETSVFKNVKTQLSNINKEITENKSKYIEESFEKAINETELEEIKLELIKKFGDDSLIKTKFNKKMHKIKNQTRI